MRLRPPGRGSPARDAGRTAWDRRGPRRRGAQGLALAGPGWPLCPDGPERIARDNGSAQHRGTTLGGGARTIIFTSCPRPGTLVPEDL